MPVQAELFSLSDELDQTLEATAQRVSALILQKHSQPVAPSNQPDGDKSVLQPAIEHDYQTVDINRLEALQARSIGTETLAYHAFKQLQLDKKLIALGFSRVDLAAVMGTIIGRMVLPGSELQTHDWLQSRSGLGEMMGHDFGTTTLTRLYTVSDKLLKHQSAIESFLSDQERTLFNLERSIVLYDLTNTYFEGQCQHNQKAQFGRSKEKRSDCPLVTLGLVLDGDGFPCRSQVFPGNASEPGTLEEMLDGLKGNDKARQIKPVIIMDAGIASADNIAWLKAHDYTYLAVSREKYKQDPRGKDGAVIVRETEHNTVTVVSQTCEETAETRVYCYSEKKAKKEQAIRNRFHVRMEDALKKLHLGLSKKGTVKSYDKILERIGRLREKNSHVSPDYRIVVSPDDDKIKAVSITWQRELQSKQKDQHSGLYCLRTNISDWSEEQLWTTYTMLTDIEATFRSLKTELGLRPVYHQKEDRVTGHLFISLLAYHLVHTLRYQLKQKAFHLSWDSIRHIMSTQQRITIILPTKDHKTIHLRTTTKADFRQKQVYDALNIKCDPLGKRKLVVEYQKSVVPTRNA